MSKQIVPRAGSARPKAKKSATKAAGTSPRGDPRRGPTLLHELSQPLTAIASFSAAAVRLAQAAPGLDPRLGSALTHIAQQVTRAAAVLEDLRTLASSPEGLPGTRAPTSATRRTQRQLIEAAEQEAASRREAADQRLASAALDQAAQAIVLCDLRGRIVRASPGAQTLCGHSPLMEAFEEAFPVHLADSTTNEGLVPRALGGETVRALARLPRSDGSTAELVISAAPLTQTEHRIQGCVVTLTDVTQWVEEKLRVARTKNAEFEAVLEAVPCSVFIARAEAGERLQCNRAAKELLQLPQDTNHLSGERPGFRAMREGREIAPEQLPAWRAGTLGLEVRGDDFELELDAGEVLQVRCDAVPLRDERGRVTGSVSVLSDVTPWRRAEAANRRMSEFLTRLSHELRNPLAPLRNSLYVLQRAAPGDARGPRAQAVIDRQVQVLTRLADDLLDVTRLTRGKVELERQRLELGPWLQGIAEGHRAALAAEAIELEVTLADRSLWVDADVARLTQVVVSLLDHAAGRTPAGGRISLSLGEAPEPGLALVQMRDTGPGIDAGALAELFEPFGQAGLRADRANEGLDLGLSLTRGLVELHGGTVAAQSDEHQPGAVVSLRLPLASSPAELAAAPSHRSHRILIIEDNLDVADSLREALGFGHHVVEVAHTGPEGLARAKEWRPDVMLCDIGLPGMSGYEVARAFRADETLKGVFLVALSGYALREDLERAQSAGFDLHLAKPPNVEKLEALLARIPRSVPSE